MPERALRNYRRHAYLSGLVDDVTCRFHIRLILVRQLMPRELDLRALERC
jgi:hypothetical protein